MERQGLSIVILSYERLRALAVLLEGLLDQRLGNLPIELIVCNNSSAVHLERSPHSDVGRLLERFPDVKVFNSSHNWLCRIRYTLGTLARYDTILFIDDDLSPTDPHLVRDLYDALATLRPIDIVSCWTALWTDWNETALTKVRMGFTRPTPSELTECDYAGPGICMFRKPILFHPAILNLAPRHQRSDSSWFPWITAMELGSRKYYFPSHGRLQVHEEHRHQSLTHLPGFRAEMYATYKQMWKRGYTPVLSRIRHAPAAGDAAALRAVETLPHETDPW